MAGKDQEPTQQTPKGLGIPVPNRKDVMDAFRRVVPERYPKTTCLNCGRSIRRAPHESYFVEGGHLCPECNSKQPPPPMSPAKRRQRGIPDPS